jgi:hypothetical protein
MWYHYIALLVGLYLVGSSLYTVITGKIYGVTGYVINGLYIAIGGYMAYWAYGTITAPAPLLQMTGGRKWY